MSAPVDTTGQLLRKARRGSVFLGLRTVALQVVILAGTVVLTRLLSPADFGTFAIVQLALSFFVLFGDAGLGAALVARKGELDEGELSGVFWLQVALASAMLAGVWALSPWLVRLWPDLPPEGPSLLRALAVTLLLTVLRTPCSILMERRLEFGRVALIDVLARVAHVAVAVALARRGFGARALVAAVLAEGVTGLLLSYLLRPFRPRWTFDRARLAPLLRFGLSVQGRSILGFVSGTLTPLYGGHVLGRHALGLHSWARGFAYFPLDLVAILSRVSFPLYSQIRDDRAALVAALGRSVRLVLAVTSLFTALVLGLGADITHLVYTDKWLPALPALHLYSGAMALGCLSPLVASALDAVGKPHLLTRLAALWTAVNWIVVPLVLRRWPTVTVFAAACCVQVVGGNLSVLLLVRRHVGEVPLARPLLGALGAVVVTAPVGRWLLHPCVTGLVSLVAALASAGLLFVGAVLTLDRDAFRELTGWLPGRAPRRGLVVATLVLLAALLGGLLRVLT